MVGTFARNASITKAIIEGEIKEIPPFYFYGCESLTNVTILANVKSIGDSSFHSCNKLQFLQIPDSCEVLNGRCFYSCDRLSNLNFPKNLAELRFSAFCFTNLSHISLEKNVKLIESNAFGSILNLKSIKIGNADNLFIDENAFQDSLYLEKIEIENVFSLNIISRNILTEIKFIVPVFKMKNWISIPCSIINATFNPNMMFIPSYLYYQNSNITEIADNEVIFENSSRFSLQQNYETIEEYAFYQCINLYSVKFPNSLKIIKNNAFYGCTSLKEVSFPQNFEVLEHDSFSGIPSLSFLNLSNTMKFIGRIDTFRDNLIDFSTTDEYDGNLRPMMFSDSQQEQYSFDGNVKEIPFFSFINSSIKNVILNDKIEIIPSYCFAYSKLERINLIKVKNISCCAFTCCSELREVIFSNNIEYIESYSFYECPNLQIIIDSSTGIITVGEYAFYSCTNRNYSDIVQHMEFVPLYCFSKCQGTENLIIPSICKIIHQRAFSESGLLTLEAMGVIEFGVLSFEKSDLLRTAILYGNIKRIGGGAFYYCRNLRTFIVHGTVSYFEDYCLFDTYSLSSLQIPADSYISENALSDNYLTFLELGKNCTIYNFPRNIHFLSIYDRINIIDMTYTQYVSFYLYYQGKTNYLDPSIYQILKIEDSQTIYVLCNYENNYFFNKNVTRIKYSKFQEIAKHDDRSSDPFSEVKNQCDSHKTFVNHYQQRLFSSTKCSLLSLSPALFRVKT